MVSGTMTPELNGSGITGPVSSPARTCRMSIRTVVVCEAQVPFVTGGAEYHVRALVDQLAKHGFSTELVRLPFKEYPKEEILAHAAAWRLIDLSESNGDPIDLVISTKFPTYFVRHPNKVVWLIHQCRAAYELCGTKFSDFDHTDEDVGVRERIIELDTQMLGECQKRFTNAANTAARLQHFNGLDAEPLYHPPPLANQLRSGDYGDYVLSVGRLEPIKRIDLALRAMQHVNAPTRLLIAGNGSQREDLEKLAATLGISDRLTFLGAVDDSRLVELYAGALAVLYAPYDEDYGYITLEAFLAQKPVITANDSGGTLEFVRHGINGLICEPTAEAIGDAVNFLSSDRRLAGEYGGAGFERARAISWDGVIEKLTSP